MTNYPFKHPTVPSCRTEAVTYHIPTSLPSPNTEYKTTISLPRHSKWTSGLHFHTTHTEYLHLVQGSIFVELDGTTQILSTKTEGANTIITVPKYARHNWGRAEHWLATRQDAHAPDDIDLDDDVVVEEWTDPKDIGKPLFFWNLNGVINAPQTRRTASQRVAKRVLGAWWIEFQLFVIFWHLDNWPVVGGEYRQFGARVFGERMGGGVQRGAEYVVTFVVLFAAKVLGWMVGIYAVEKGRTPKELWDVYAGHEM
ncbi:hypothetical protein GQ44DRAFT_749777 [Phaeosphaeriaceae sp. PMI808]|nr:hypothetical protein GQ44DRAFT_749777 [Phaeosphaeriaceae sp. PMI808]